jgi:hypothetical protein
MCSAQVFINVDCILCILFLLHCSFTHGDRGSTVVKVLRYKSEGYWFQSQMVSLEFFTDINPSDHTMALGLNQPLTEMSTESISWG